MEMPVDCSRCGEWVELNSTQESPLNKQLLCSECCSLDNQVNCLLEEGKDILYGLENNEEYMKGDRRGWKKNLQEIKDKIKTLGFDFNDFT